MFIGSKCIGAITAIVPQIMKILIFTRMAPLFTI